MLEYLRGHVAGGIEPHHRGVGGQPCELFLGVDARIFFNARDSCVAVHNSVEMCEPFFETHGIQGVEMPQWIESAGFFFHTGIKFLENLNQISFAD